MLRILFLIHLLLISSYGLDHWKGSQRALVLLLQWNDTSPNTSVEQIRSTFFGESDRGLKQFFAENSAGKFRLTGEVLDWQTTTKNWDPKAGCSLTLIVEEAWKISSDVISVGEFDSDKNGKIDNLFVVHSGRIPYDRVGPECTFVNNSKADHTIVFQAEGLGSIGDSIPIGFYIHEAGHGYFSLPDLYGDHYHGRYGIGMWGMMGLGAWGTHNQIPRSDIMRFPSHFEPLSKIKMGWANQRIINSSQEYVVLKPVEETADIVTIPAGFGSNYYLEFRTNRGFSLGSRGQGLLIWKDFDLVQADGRDDLNNGNNLGYRPLPPIDENFGDESDPFPGSQQVTLFEDTAAGIKIQNITHFSDRIEFSIAFKTPGVPYSPSIVPRFNGKENL